MYVRKEDILHFYDKSILWNLCYLHRKPELLSTTLSSFLQVFFLLISKCLIAASSGKYLSSLDWINEICWSLSAQFVIQSPLGIKTNPVSWCVSTLVSQCLLTMDRFERCYFKRKPVLLNVEPSSWGSLFCHIGVRFPSVASLCS